MSAETFDALILALDPVGYWKLDETSGTVAQDSSGHARHGSWQGEPALSQGGYIMSRPAPAFRKGGPWVKLPPMPVNTTSGTTIVALIRGGHAGSEYACITQLCNAGESAAWIVHIPYNRLQRNAISALSYLGGQPSNEALAAHNDGFALMVASVSSRYCRVYINGKLVSQVPQAAANADGVRQFGAIGKDAVGVTHTDTRWVGALSHVAVINTELTAAQVDALWQACSSTIGLRSPALGMVGTGPANSFNGVQVVEGSHATMLSGPGSIAGTVSIEGVTARRRVMLQDVASGALVAEAWSHPVTGAYRFSGLLLGRPFCVLAHDHERRYNAAVADYVTAEVLP